MLDINAKKLREILIHMKEIDGISYRRMEDKSGASNLSRVVRDPSDSNYLHPTTELWYKLHVAFPDRIPEPEYVNGGIVYKNIAHRANTVNQSARDINFGGSDLTAQQRTLIDLLKEYDKDGEIVRDMIFELLKKGRNESDS